MADDAPQPRARSLAEDLRSRSDAALQALLASRPDLLNPIPSDLSSLAARAASRPSVQRVLDQLNLFYLQVIDALCVLPDQVSVREVVALVGADVDDTLDGIDKLREQALVFGDDDNLSVVRTLREVVGPPAGLGPSAEALLSSYGSARLDVMLGDHGLPPTGDASAASQVLAGVLADPDRLTRLLADAPDDALKAARALATGPPTGRVERARREVDVASAATPVEWLLARGLLVGLDDATVALPREVALHLRGGRVHPDPQPAPPELALREVDRREVQRAAAGAAFTLVRLVEDAVELWSAEPPKALRAGGLGVRERARAAASLDVSETFLSLLVEVAHAAGLFDVSADVEEVWLPTPTADRWLEQDTAARWAMLVTAWVDTTRVAGLAGTTDQRGRALVPLGPDLDRALAPEVRRSTLACLAEAAARGGRSSSAAPTTDSLVARISWHAPRRGGRLRDDLVRWTTEEAELLGVTGRGALCGAASALLAEDQNGAERELAAQLPAPLEHVLLQADLTAVAPGPLTSDLARRLRMVANVESTGGATVYRFGEATVRRALDAGWSADDVVSLLERHSRTPIPQPLSYLVQDVARRHGRIRVGAASSYVRCDDESLVSEIAADRRVAQLRLRRLAPTVLAAQASGEVVLARLREIGHAPAAEGTDGDVVVRRRDVRRAAVRRPVPKLVVEREKPQPDLLSAAVRALRAGDRATTALLRRDPATGRNDSSGVAVRRPVADVLATLQQAVATGEPLWVGYVNAEGHASERIVEPISVQGGYVSAYDHLRDEVRTFSLHRITGVSTLEE